MSYSNVHKFLLRLVASRGILSVHDTLEVISNSYPEFGEFSVKDLVMKINEQIKPYKQMIKIVHDESTLKEEDLVLVFISFGYDKTSKSQNMFSSKQMDYFRILLEQIMTTESRQITAINAINLSGSGTISVTEAEDLLITWCRMHYLEKIGTNYLLGLRAIHEFERYFIENMPDTIQNCSLCKTGVFRGYNCPACEEAVHTFCLMKYTDKHHKWPCCKADFNQAHLDRLNCQGVSSTINSSRLQRQSENRNSISTNNETIDLTDNNYELDNYEMVPEISQKLKRKRRRS